MNDHPRDFITAHQADRDITISIDAFALHHLALAGTIGRRPDGYVADEWLDANAADHGIQVLELVLLELWVREDDGYRVHDPMGIAHARRQALGEGE